MSLFRFCLKLNRLIDQIMFIDFILLSHPYDKSLGDAQSFNFTFFIFYKGKTARRLRNDQIAKYSKENTYQNKQVLCDSGKVQINRKSTRVCKEMQASQKEGIHLISNYYQGCQNGPRSPQSLYLTYETVY